MRCVLLFFLGTSVSLAQQKLYNDEFRFTIEIPFQWYATTENDWSDKVKDVLKKHYWSSKPLLILNPSNTETLNVPSVIVTGIKLKKTSTSEAIVDLKKNGRDRMTSSARIIAKYDVLGEEINQYREADIFYNYDSSKNLATAIIVYEHKNKKTSYFTAATSKFIGLKQVVDLTGYWKGSKPEEFRLVFISLINSFSFDSDAIAPFGSSIEGRNTSEKILNQVLKWGGILLTISIILGFARMLLKR